MRGPATLTIVGTFALRTAPAGRAGGPGWGTHTTPARDYSRWGWCLSRVVSEPEGGGGNEGGRCDGLPGADLVVGDLGGGDGEPVGEQIDRDAGLGGVDFELGLVRVVGDGPRGGVPIGPDCLCAGPVGWAGRVSVEVNRDVNYGRGWWRGIVGREP